MITFLVSIVLLILGYVFYGTFLEKLFGINPAAATPAVRLSDGVDYVAMPTWKVYMIQFLNIAGTGPIFGAILGAQYGPSCYLWIVFGSIFGGAMHDFLSAMLSLRNDGVGLPKLVGKYLGNKVKRVMLIFSVFMLILVGTVFVLCPAQLLGAMTGGGQSSLFIWIGVIFAYYIIATLVPIDKIIGKCYPVFAVAIIFMAIALATYLFVHWPTGIPEIWDGLQNRAPQNGRIFPLMFITIACGAISGFHATQSPLMARCIKNEKYCRPVYYGSMITEGIIALIWATVASYFFYGGGAEALGINVLWSMPESGSVPNGSILASDAPGIVTMISKGWLGVVGGILALLGIVFAPVTSGDTALRSARLIVAEALHLPQKEISNRLKVGIPIFVITFCILWIDIVNKEGFNMIWQYFGWANQTLSVFTLWTITAYLMKHHSHTKHFLVAAIPACFMTAVCTTFICTSKIGFNIDEKYSLLIALLTVSICVFFTAHYRLKHEL